MYLVGHKKNRVNGFNLTVRYLTLILLAVSLLGAEPKPKEEPKSEAYCQDYCGTFWANDYVMCLGVPRCELVVYNQIKACVLDCEGQSK